MSILFSPAKIGNLTVKNRFVSSATVECLITQDNKITEKYFKVYKRLAKGGVGLIIPGNYFVSKSGVAVAKNLVIDNNNVIPDLQKLTNLVHENDAKIVAQLNHGGRQCDPKIIGQKPVSPSSVRDNLTGIKPRKLQVGEIEEIIEDFANAALRVQKSGFDGIQLNAAHGYLINQFLSSRTNRRKDEWGGSLENRMLFLTKIFRAIRDKVGNSFPILVKINSQDNIKKGVSLNESIILSQKLDELGVDAIEISGGIKETGFTTTKGSIPKDVLLKNVSFFKRLLFVFIKSKLKKSAKFHENYHLSQAIAIKKNVSVPIILVGGVRNREKMEMILNEGQADFIAMSRPFIRQPSLVNQFIKYPNSERITCVNCNKCTVEITVNNKPLRCYYNPKKE
jgi:2,4-dienoyl-CoA reductase-like NADH-dependent reductase (Old Yellow Enzyme family)